jgi:hypothetical protein
MSAWLTPLSLAGLFVSLVFFIVAFRRPARGVLFYAILGATPPVVQIGAFSGRNISQGLLLAELLATMLILAWLVRRPTGAPSVRAPFTTPWLAFAAAAVVSLSAAQALPDPSVQRDVTFMVSVGQVLLILWPIGVYFAAAEAIDRTRLIRHLQTAVIWLSVPQLLSPFLPDHVRPYMAWAVTFGLFASPLALARAFYSPSVVRRILYVAIAIVPLVRGLEEGKAFLYVFVLASSLTILALRATKLLVVGGGLAAAVVLIMVFAYGEASLTEPVGQLVDVERRQASWGGRAGRVQLAEDAFSIWEKAPLLGVGPGNSYVYMLKRSSIGTPHNQYLNLLVEVGLVGLVCWLWFLVQALRTGLQIYRRARDPEHVTLALGWLGLFAGMVVGSITGDFMVHSIRNGGLELFSGYYLQWVLLGALVSVARLEGLQPLTLVPHSRPAIRARHVRWVPAPAVETWARHRTPRFR